MPRTPQYKKIARDAAGQLVASCNNGGVSVVKCVAALLHDPNISAALLAEGSDYVTSLEACRNISVAIDAVKYVDRYNGVTKGVLASCVGTEDSSISLRRAANLFNVHRSTISKARKWRGEWSSGPDVGSLVKRTSIVRYRINKNIPAFITDWIKENCVPSSNTKNTVLYVGKDGTKERHVIHWRTETIESLFQRCRVAVNAKFGHAFRRTYFYKAIPSFVRMKKMQSGLCPHHHTGISLCKELIRKRSLWHRNCTCDCVYCSADGCDHGKNPQGGICSRFSCQRCRKHKCHTDWCDVRTNWRRPEQRKRTGGGLYWYDQEYTGTRKTMMKSLRQEMLQFNKHAKHVEHHRDQKQILFDNFAPDEIIIQTDFIQNIVHSRGRETSQSYYGKRQTQFLSFVIWYWVLVEGVLQKQKLHVDYLSSYLKHNSLYFQKCLIHLLTYIRDDVGVNFRKVWLLSDGGRAHFKSRISFWFISTLIALFRAIFHWIFAPSNHGKGECDSHGAVVKRGIRLWILDDKHHVDDEEEAVEYINNCVNNSEAFLMEISRDDKEQDCSAVYGSNSMHEFRFEGEEGEVFVREYNCSCAACLAEDFQDCENRAYVGTWKFRQMKPKGFRIPEARYQQDVVQVMEDGEEEFVVESIVGSRYYEGKQQYQVLWDGYEEPSWVDADTLDCIELIEEYECGGAE